MREKERERKRERERESKERETKTKEYYSIHAQEEVLFHTFEVMATVFGTVGLSLLQRSLLPHAARRR